jgi:hypothetical protein
MASRLSSSLSWSSEWSSEKFRTRMINVFLDGAPRLPDLETIWKQTELRRRFGNHAKWQVRQIDPN